MAETPGKMYALATFLTLLAFLAILLRFYARAMKRTKFSYDDYMILPAMLFTIGTAICMYVGTALGDMARHTAVDDTGAPIFTHRTVVFEQIVFASALTQTLTFGFTKLTVLLLYRRIFTGETFRRVVWAGFAMVFTWTVGFFFANLFQCWPISVNWTGFGGDPWYCINSNIMLIAHAWTDVFTDVIILMMPLPCIWALQMKTMHKVGVSAIFLLGFLTVGAGIARLVIFENVEKETDDDGSVDVTYLLTPTVYWPMVESSLGIVGACLPLMRPLFTGAASKGFVRKLRNISFPTLSYYDPNSSKGSGSTVVASSEGSANQHGSGEFARPKPTYIVNHSRGLDPYGLLDEEHIEKELAKESISCTTEIKISSEAPHAADDLV